MLCRGPLAVLDDANLLTTLWHEMLGLSRAGDVADFHGIGDGAIAVNLNRAMPSPQGARSREAQLAF